MATAEAQPVDVNRTSENLYNSSDEEQAEQGQTLLACLICGCTNGSGQTNGRSGGIRRRREASAVDLSSWAEPRSSRGVFSLEDALAPVVKAYKNFIEKVGGDVTLVASSFDSESEDSDTEHRSRGQDSGDIQAVTREEFQMETHKETTENQNIKVSDKTGEAVQSSANETSGAIALSPRRAAAKIEQERRSKRFQRHSEVERQLSETDPQTALKYRLKALFRRVAHPKDTYLNSSGSAGGQIVDGEFLLLAKVYVVQCEEEELDSFARNDPASLKHLLPFLLNSLLYGTYDIQREYLQQPSELTRTTSRFGSAEKDSTRNSRKEFASLNHLRHEMRFLQEARLLKLISNYNVTDSYRGAFRLHGKVRRQRLKEARERAAARKAQLEDGTGSFGSTTLSGTIFGERGYMDSLEPFVLKQCMRSVEFALHCFWYFQSSLVTGPEELYSRTLRLLLSVEAAVVHHQIPYNIFLQESNGEILEPSMTHASGVSSQENNLNHWNMPPSSSGIRNSLDLHENSVREWWNSRMERSSMFHAEIDFIKGLTDISAQLRKIPRESRQEALRKELEKLNAFLPRNVAIPTENRMHRILRVVPEYSVALSTKERCPFLLVYEMEDLSSEGVSSPRKTHREEESSSHELWSVEEEFGRQSEGDERDSDEINFTKKFAITKRLGRESSHQMRRTERAAMKKEAVALAAGGAFENEPNRPEESFNFQPNVNTDVVLSRERSELGEGTNDVTIAQITFNNTEEPNRTVQNESGWTGMVEVDLQDPTGQNNQVSNTQSFKSNLTCSPSEGQLSGRREDAPDSNTHAAFGEPFAEKEKRLKDTSPFSYLRRWRLGSCIVKAHDQLRQEMFATRLIAEFARIYAASGLPLWLRPYNIIATSSDSGIIETVRDSTSLDSIKRNTPNFTTLADFFHRKFGERGSPRQKMALRNFVESMAGYSVVQYLLQIKDRHNGNILIDSEGHIIHIDFGFLLSNSPGGNFEFEKSPFKLSAELVQVMGGVHSAAFRQFRKLCVQGYVECCHHRDKIVLMVDMFYSGNENLPCFTSGRDAVIENLRKRFMPGHTRLQRAQRMMRLIDESIDNWHTRWYDRYQRLFTGIH
ncbi:Phosphatidylinositol 4-kinase [Galdieria sulphuraria]|uniref:1-phosphatidylinositol 4-kinase n=1 Tax=Galdieria sulphuraria TaxID=130081 RepID=M2Y556_GALSU|nr:phosphatidylinositol 4-kinase [Galdieria sulphuraria]EME30989.1 phosphatidylinositol 4-kinase [Galdieria sulphuraria]GJD10940.1 Phosphatidylinositol 4-kinase [Galdieria sulphuraria]|eukprot:XP_005707509.1 phosphatidylinositol 4-kinase [Galdieria sulphuraria]